jgi:hypothetical protein
VTDQDELSPAFEEGPDLLVGPDRGRTCDQDGQQENCCVSHDTILIAMAILLPTGVLLHSI